MTTTDTELHAQWRGWHAEREEQLREPQGWLSLTALEWLDDTPRSPAGLPGTWRVSGPPERLAVELVAAAGDGLLVDGVPVDGAVVLEPQDGLAGTIVVAGDRHVEVVRRTASFALRVRDPQAPTRTGFDGVPTFAVDPRWVVPARFEAFEQPRRITVDAVVDGLRHYPIAEGVVEFELAGEGHRLVALGSRLGGLTLHFRDATSGVSTYGGGRVLRVDDPAPDGALVIDFNRTVNLPCAFTAYATCPLPPAENRLTVAVEAGERTPA